MYEKNDRFYWFEHSFEKYKGIHEFNTQQELIEFIKDKQLEYAIEKGVANLEDKKLIETCEYTKPQKNCNVDEYIEHVTLNEYNY